MATPLECEFFRDAERCEFAALILPDWLEDQGRGEEAAWLRDWSGEAVFTDSYLYTGHSDGCGDGDSNNYGNGHGDGYGNSDGDGDGDGHSRNRGDGYGDGDGCGDGRGDGCG